METIDLKKAIFSMILRIFIVFFAVAAILVGLYFIILFYVLPHNKYVKEDIDKIVYAEPTEEAKNFDIQKYIDSLPSVKYEKISYPVKETHTYEFNGYALTVDIPEGYEAYKLKMSSEPEVIDSTSIEDSCDQFNRACYGPRTNSWLSTEITSDNELCITNEDMHSKQTKYCNGITISPSKSKFKGVSLRDYYMRIVVLNYNQKFITDDLINFSLYKDGYKIATTLISDDQILSTSPGKNTDNNLYFSIINSVKIKKKE